MAMRKRIMRMLGLLLSCQPILNEAAILCASPKVRVLTQEG